MHISFSFHFIILFLSFLFGTANKKAKLINGSQQQEQNYGLNKINSSVDEHQYYQAQHSRPGGPNLVNKQLVLPFVPPSFPNGLSDSSNHLIKPSEYLKSISDKRSNAGSTR